MKLWTSNFAKSGADANAVSIARSSPKGWMGREFDLLFPDWSWIRNFKNGRWSWEQYSEAYAWLLSEFDAENICASLGDGAIMLCFCSPKQFCHRRLVAEWIERETGLLVLEIKR